MRIISIALVAFGVAVLLYGGIRYTRRTSLLEVGPFQATTTEQKKLPIAPVVGVIALLGGGLMLLAGPRKRLV